jgi:hypothetical protein
MEIYTMDFTIFSIVVQMLTNQFAYFRVNYYLTTNQVVNKQS